MPRFKVAQLVRDLRPALFEASGGVVGYHTMADGDFRQALMAKLLEESHEAIEACGTPDVAKELADVLEVLQALAKLDGLDWQTVEEVRASRAQKIGRFENKVFVEWVEGPEESDITLYHRQYPEKYPEEPAQKGPTL